MFSSQCPRACHVIISFSFSSSTKLLKVPIILTENDIPGASLNGRNPSSLKNEELKVQEYITSGRDKMVVDPDKDKIYTRRKTRLSNLPAERSPETPAPKYPSDGWGKSLERMPPFSRAEMNQHIESSGKKVGNADNHSIPTNLRKAKTFLKDEYLKDIEANNDQ
ncbi:hypothetical protein pdam_00013970, partial [Pocillopora damicornis]